jgi:CHAT domain-containing protein
MQTLQETIKKQPALAKSADTQHQIAELQKDLEAGNRAFQQFLGELKQHFAAKPDRAASIDLRETEGLKTDLADLKHGSVAVYTLIAADRYVAILVTPKVQRAYESTISSEDLNQKIFAFREAIQTPGSDPRPLANELYRILIPDALASDLKQAHASTLMWSLDGPLRYVPISALYDGHQYLIEKYRIAVFTPASNARLKEVPQPNWRGVAFGVTQAHPGFDPLPGVAAELHGIIREKPGDPGVLEGHELLDQQFTRVSLDRELLAGFPVVHVASHFQFRPGDETRSFLLLGDGGQLTLADLKSADTIFAGVDLLTLSACSTGLGDVKNSDGSEVEGFGVLAQRKGAKAVVASLWPVADASTGLLMQEFYRIRQADPKSTKIEALRRAQLRLMNGEIKPVGVANARGVKVPRDQNNKVRDYQHPYYWAPFFLMGNWL